MRSIYALGYLLLIVTAVYSAGTPTGRTLDTHTIYLDASSKLMSWVTVQDQAYATVAKLSMEYLLTSVPIDSENGKPAYYSHSYMDPNTQTPVGWPHNPAGLYGMIVESGIRYYQYSGDARALTLAKAVVDAQLANGLTTSTNSWSSVPYASGDSGSLTYKGASYGDSQNGAGDGVGVIEPDKVGEFGYALIQIYELTGTQSYLTAAVKCADALVSHLRTGLNANTSPWPFRVVAATNVVRETYCSNVAGALRLFDRLVALQTGSTTSYSTTSATVLAWALQYPLVNNYWQGYFEDVPYQPTPGQSRNQYNAMMFARYLLENPSVDSSWLAHVRTLLSFVKTTFGVTSDGATQIKEQEAFFYRMGSHTSRYASINALLYEKAGDTAALEEAYRSFNWASYMARSNGVVIDGPEVNNQWFTDGYADYIRHFMVGMGAAPQWAPAGQTHLLATTSVVTAITYGTTVAYSVFDSTGIEKLKTAQTPTSVTVDGVALPQSGTLTAGTWTYTSATQVLQINRSSGKSVVVGFATGPTTQAPTPGPTPLPTAKPTAAPTPLPTPLPTAKPTAAPTSTPPPTAKPTASGLYTQTTTPPIETTDLDSVNLGLKFKVTAASSVTGIQVYRGAGVTISSARLWNAAGTSIGSLTFSPSSSTTAGWVRANFASPIAITANTFYTISYLAPGGKYAAKNNGFSTARTVGKIVAGVNAGVYNYATTSAFPTDVYQASEYFVSPLVL